MRVGSETTSGCVSEVEVIRRFGQGIQSRLRMVSITCLGAMWFR